MKTKHWKHEQVNENGVVESGGAVNTKRNVKIFKGTPCNCNTCNNEHDFIVINYGRNPFTSEVKGMTLYFNNTKQLNQFVDKLDNINDLLYLDETNILQ